METLPLFTPAPPAAVPSRPGPVRPRPGEAPAAPGARPAGAAAPGAAGQGGAGASAAPVPQGDPAVVGSGGAAGSEAAGSDGTAGGAAAAVRASPGAGCGAHRHGAPRAATPPAPAPASTASLEELHPALWRAHQLGRQHEATGPSGFSALDAALPGGGWPARVLTELLLPRPGIGEMRLLAPALAAVQRDERSVMLFDPPALPFGAALADCGIALDRLFVVRNREARRGRANGPLPAADILWAVEQTLRSGHVGAVVAWLPSRLPAEALRRLQLAAQAHDGPVFVLRDDAARTRPSVAPLRLWLCIAGADALRVHLLKRRGPPLAQPIVLALPPVLAAAARERARTPVVAPAARVRPAVQEIPR